MFVKFQLCVVACAIALTGCVPMAGSPGVRKERDRCTSPVCKVEVAVADCASGDIRANPETIDISRDFQNVQIHWDLDRFAVETGYTFTERGIVIREDTDNQFTDPQRVENGRKFIWKDKNNNERTYKYDIAIRRGETVCRPKDPFIDNGR